MMVGVGFVNPLRSLSPAALNGELVGLGSGNLDKWAVGGVLTGDEGADGLRGFFVGEESSRAAVWTPNALRVLVLRIVDIGWLGGPIGLSTLKVDFLPPGDGVGEISDRVPTVLSDKDGRGLRLSAAGCGLACCC